MVRLVPMDHAEAQRFLDWSASNYMEELIRAGAASSPEEARAQMPPIDQMLPQGPATPGMYFWHIEDEEAGERRGSLWFCVRERAGYREGWVYYVVVDEEYRGKGYGRAALIALEEEARKLGAGKIGLQVFAYNTPAYRLYEGLGYREISSFMLKDLSEMP